ncbi:FkbM family methyltransferase [Pseudohoeflea coraliihabitans]|uniref:FkbM family methyltransferase n=1 Tax=Pseudohoeflea coraliihabitans TaxID=2860393 RepID=A0ABS6WIF8_9HYPH|nr:FkbM family methyltransferase [Pseudohoeflea sp. DP4N28-3]MBW3095711.1 FkbM family methyltransferase [Pseudohoeflea sp. DP4N28-3]
MFQFKGLRRYEHGGKVKFSRLVTRKLRLAIHHALNGPDFSYHGIRITVPDTVMFSLKRQLMRGMYEEAEREIIARHLDPDSPVIELGGSIGVVSAFIASRLSPRIRHRIVEANPALIDICRHNAVRARAGEGTDVVWAAVAYGAQEVAFTAGENTLGSRVAPAGEGDITVPTTTLAEQIAAINAGDGYTLIMDIEAMELEVLANERGALAHCRMAFIEFHPGLYAQEGRTVAEFFALAAEAGFEVFDQVDDVVALRRASGNTPPPPL